MSAGASVPGGDADGRAPSADETTTARWLATRFDGRSAAGTPVELTLAGMELRIDDGTRTERRSLAEVQFREAFEHAPAMVQLADGATLEVRDPQRTLPAALRRAGRRESLVVRMQRRWPAVLFAAVALVAGLAWTYAVGLPAVADQVARWTPRSAEARVGEPMLQALDYYAFRPSALAGGRRDAIARLFQEAAGRSAPGVPVRIEFRAGGTNAFALPGGVIVVLDELVEFTQDDDELLGVLAHELGHVAHRHPLRLATQALGLAAIAGVLWGDVSGVVANATAALGTMHYGRAFEREADDFAVAFLAREGHPPDVLDAVFARLAERAEAQGGEPPDFLSSHPSVGERRARLRGSPAPDGAPAR